MVYAEFGGQTECIMGNWKIENGCILLETPSFCDSGYCVAAFYLQDAYIKYL